MIMSSFSLEKLLEELQHQNLHILAHAIKRSADLSVQTYSELLWHYQPQHDLEPEFIEACQEELQSTGYSHETITTIMQNMRKHRTLQTSAHTEIVPPPRRLCIDWISTQSLPSSQPYLIGAFSGVPFSNKSRPGRFTFQGKEYNVIPKTHQDALVYETKVSERIMSLYQNLPEQIKSAITQPMHQEYFSTWASRIAGSLLQKTLRKEVFVFDINAVTARYLEKVLHNPEHILTKLLCDEQSIQKILRFAGKHLHFFYTPYETGKYTKQENLYYLDGYGFAGDHEKFPYDKEKLQEGLRSRKLCPATFLVFTVFAFLNEFQCFGSFVQVEYLTQFKKAWQELKLLPHDITSIPSDTLTTGMFPTEPMLQILDVAIEQKKIPRNPEITMAELYEPIWRLGQFYKKEK